MEYGVDVFNTFVGKQVNDISSHILEDVSLYRVRLVGTTVA